MNRPVELTKKLVILVESVKYDASCSSKGGERGGSRGSGGNGSHKGRGICGAYAADGHCISLLKILLTHFCVYDCVNGRSSDVQRARFSLEDVARLALDFYRRNYLEGPFLSARIIRAPDYAAASDRDVLKSSSYVYRSYRLRRFYYAGFSPIRAACKSLPLWPPLLQTMATT